MIEDAFPIKHGNFFIASHVSFCGENPILFDPAEVVNTVSTVLVGHLGKRDLAAVGLAVSLANVSGYSVPWQGF